MTLFWHFEYCRNAYKRLHDTQEVQRTTTVCQRENPFYVDTVRAFRDRRYEYKQMLKLKMFYPGAMLNALVKDRFTNDQYHNVNMATGECTVSSENSIFFEVFKRFLEGATLQEIYENVAKEANYWLDILHDKGQTLSRRELFDLIGESKNMSKQLEEYGEQKSTSISTAKRLAEFLGADIVRSKGSLACSFVISRFPLGDPVSERTLPLAIFDAAPKERVKFLRKWTKANSLGEEFGSDKCLKELIDWQYYIERLGSTIQKIVTIPAALQGISNPVPRVLHPQWLENKRRERIEMHTQPRITDMFKVRPPRLSIKNGG
ncbi:hypothetical protein niasHT_000493 [Heterodera trifolii]|uniref:DNA polymerase epsilon catalytic subunit n=1 Tax=Heterodera trifolii TaxID=157864 RepID=A0ABD2LU11_9BILA